MKIKKISIINFGGIKGKHEYDFPEIVALCGKNGTGKTSFVNALRFALTGYLPTGEVTTGTEFAAVQVETESGHKFMRQKFAKENKSIRCAYDGKTISAKQLNQYLEAETGVPVDTAKLAATGELLTSLTNQQFGELLLKYLPEELTVELITERIEGITDSQKEIVKEVFEKIISEGNKTFATASVDEAYKTFYERRKLLKKAIEKNIAIYENYASVKIPEETPEEIQAKLDETMKRRDASVLYGTQKKIYDDAVLAKKQYDERVSMLQKQISEIQVKDISDEEVKKLEQKKSELQTQILTLNNKRESEKATGSQLFSTVQAMKENSKGCPFAKEKLGVEIPCTTDMSAYATDFLKKLKEIKAYLDSSAIERQKLMNEYTAVDRELTQASVNATEARRKKDFQVQLESLKGLEPKVPEAPTLAEALSVLDAEIKKLTSEKVLVENKEKIQKLGESIQKYESALKDYDFLVLQFSPKGAVKESITSYYLDTFAETVNAKAKELFPGMNVKFVTDNGVKILIDMHGDDAFLEYSQLSGGEKACVMFLMLDLLSKLSGFNTIILDELSVLDGSAFTKLLTLIINHKEEYDHIVISSVDSTEYKRVLKTSKIGIFKLSTTHHLD